MNFTPEDVEVMKEYANLKMESPTTSVHFHYIIEPKEPYSHGQIVELVMISESPDGALTDLTFPDRMRFAVNLWACDEQTAGFICWLVRTWKPLVCFETGTNKGRSTKAIADSLELNGKGHITTVDVANHGVQDRLPRTTFIQGHLPEGLKMEPLASLSDIDFAFLDGPHYENEVLQELEFVKARKAKRGCYVLFDDAGNGSWPGVCKAVKELPGAFILPTPHGLGIVHLDAEK